MPTTTEIRTAVATEAEAGIQSSTIDGNTVVNRDLTETLDVAARIDGVTAAALPFRGLRPTQMCSPGGHQ